MYVNQYDFAQFYEISTKKLLDEGLSEYAMLQMKLQNQYGSSCQIPT